MDPERPAPRPGALSELEARLLAAAVGKRLFQKPADPVQLGRYRLIERIGQGGMSVVFRAHDPQLRREVAVKLLHSPRGRPDPEQPARLRREAVALGRLSHPNVVQVFEIGEVDGQLFVAMELVRGTTLRAWLSDQPRTLPEILATISQAGRGLAAAHAAGIVHRDFKPENVLVGADGRVRVVDFGLARASEAPTDTTGALAAPLTRSGTVLGTPAFMAPEQLRDPTCADARSDQFSLCVLAWEALFGERPFADQAAAAEGRLRAVPADSSVPAPLRAALERGLRPDPADRWPTLDALLAALERATPPASAGATTTPSSATRRRWLPALAALALVTAAALAVLAWQPRRPADDGRLAAVECQLAAMLAADETRAAELLLAQLVADPQPAGPPIAAQAWASWARMLAQARPRSPRDPGTYAHAPAAGDPGTQQAAPRGLARPHRHAGAPALADDDPTAQQAAQRRLERAHRDAWAHAYALAGDDPGARQEALLGLARAHRDARDLAGALALIEAEAPSLLTTPELAALLTGAPDPAPGERAQQHARALELAGAPRQVVALARAGSLDLAASTLVTLARRAAPPTRGTWQLAAAALAEATDDEPRALALLTAAAEDPDLRDAALAQQAALLTASGRLDEAAQVHATRLAGAPQATDAAAQRDRLAALLATRAALPLRFAGAAPSPWTAIEPAALHGDPPTRALIVDGHPGALAAATLDLRGDRLLVELDVQPHSLAPGAFVLRVTTADPRATAELALRVAEAPGDDELAPELRLTCGPTLTPPNDPPPPATGNSERPPLTPPNDPGPVSGQPPLTPPNDPGPGGRQPLTPPNDPGPGGGRPPLTPPNGAPLRLQLDIDAAAGVATCRSLAPDRRTIRREQVALAGPWAPGPARLELRGPDTGPAGMRVTLTRLELTGAPPVAPSSPPPLARAGAPLVDGDAHTAAKALAELAEPRARLWHAVALARLGRWQQAAPLLDRALADDPGLDEELRRWLRGDPHTLAPALRQMLGERRYLELFARTWERELAAPTLAPDIVRLALAELGGQGETNEAGERCGGADCATLWRARGLALAQIGELAAAQAALSAALRVAPDDPAGRALARRILLDLALVRSPQ